MSSPNYTYSYSGSDCDAYAFFPGSEGLQAQIESSRERQNVIDTESMMDDKPLQFDKNKIAPYNSRDLGEAIADPEQDYSIEDWDQEGLRLSNNLFTPIKLTQMATISISIHEAKSPVRRLGERGVSGYTRGIRTIAGTIVFLIVEDHPLRMLAVKDPANAYRELIGWSRDAEYRGVGSTKNGETIFDNKISTLISPMNIMLRYQTEVAAGFINYSEEQETRSIGNNTGASMMLEGVEFVNEGIVTSVNDMVTEVVCQFVAQDIRPFTDHNERDSAAIVREYSKTRTARRLYEGYYRKISRPTALANPNLPRVGSVEVDVEDYKGE
jgi:hypothetical protein